MSSSNETQTQPSSVRKVVIPGPPSLSARLFWWALKLLLPIIAGGTPPPPPKGPQIWDLPPPRLKSALKAGTVELGEWKEETSGWVIPTLKSKAKGKGERPRRAALYFHGGGFTRGLSGSHWTWVQWLAEKLDAEFYLVPYPLAPTNTGLEVMPVLLDIYKSFLVHAQGQEILTVGDSAGSVIAIGLAYAAHSAGIKLPHQIIAVSPGVDLTRERSPAELAALVPLDPMNTPDFARTGRRLWAGVSADGPEAIPEHIASDPTFNPGVGDPSVFREAGTQLVVSSGTWDIMHPPVREFVEKAERAGVSMVYIEGQSQLHVFPMMRRFVKEGEIGAQAIVEAVLSYSSK